MMWLLAIVIVLYVALIFVLFIKLDRDEKKRNNAPLYYDDYQRIRDGALDRTRYFEDMRP